MVGFDVKAAVAELMPRLGCIYGTDEMLEEALQAAYDAGQQDRSTPPKRLWPLLMTLAFGLGMLIGAR